MIVSTVCPRARPSHRPHVSVPDSGLSDVLQSTNRRLFKEGYSSEQQAKFSATPAAGARTAKKGVDQRLFQEVTQEPDMNGLLQHPSCPKSQKIRSIYQSAHAAEPVLRYHRQFKIAKNMSKDEVEARWHRSLLQWWGRGEDAAVTQASTNFSVLPAGTRRRETENKASHERKQKNAMAETKFDEPSAWAVDRAKEPKNSQYWSEYHKAFVAHVANAVDDIKARLPRKQTTSVSIYKSFNQDKAPASGAQESTYQHAFGKPRSRGRKKASKFDDI